MTVIRKRIWTTSSGEENTAWQVDYRDGAGKRRSKQFARKKEAEAWLVSAAWQVSQGTHTPDSQSITVSAAAKIWIERAEDEKRERGTIQQYRQLANLHIIPLIGAEKLSRLSRPGIEAFRDELVKTRSRSMANKVVRALSMILNEAQRRGMVAQNVAQEVKVSQSGRDKKRITVPPKSDLVALLGHADDTMKPFLMVAVFAGLRASELRGLRWSDIDLKGNKITVAQRADKFGEIGPPKSAAGHRTIPLPLVVVSELKKWKLQCPNGKLDLVFPNSEGGVQDYSHLRRRKFEPLQIASGICNPVLIEDKPKLDAKGNPMMQARYGLHDLRHAAASAWIKQRVDLKRLQVWMGHSSIQITLDTYGHLIEDAASDAALAAAAEAELFS